jgi:two-component system, OmpR family, response regulator MtrA
LNLQPGCGGEELDLQMNETILLVEDDSSVRQSATMVLERAGFEVTPVGDGKEALVLLGRQRVDLVLLDVMLPVMDGFEVCREIRRSSRLPIVMLTARTDTTDVVVGLELGADDYVTKPFEGRELAARVRAVLRRAAAEPDTPILKVRDLEIDAAAHRASRCGEALELTATEFRLLVVLARNAGNVLTREVLLERVWGYDYLGDSRLVDMAVKRLRDKLSDDPKDPSHIATIRGIGYRFEPE